MKKEILFSLCLLMASPILAKVKIVLKTKTPQTEYAASRLSELQGNATIRITVRNAGEAEGFTIQGKGKSITITGNDGAGAIYGANYVRENFTRLSQERKKFAVSSVPEMKMRGACVGLQKTVYLPGHRVYEYPYTPENFPWFYDRDLWIRYLDLLAENNMNTVYLWNGHPFASLVKLKDYPFAPEVDDATMQRNQEMFGFLVDEADRRGIRVIQMFYNIILSKPFVLVISKS